MRHQPARTALAATLLLLALGHAQADSTGRWRSGQEAYQKVCAYCHEAQVGPVLTGRNLPPVYIKTVVRMGNRAMPAMRESEIDEAVLDSLAQLIANSPAGAKQ